MLNTLHAKTGIILLFLSTGALSTFRSSGQPAQNHIIIDAANIRNTIPPTMFGTCIEDVNHEI